MQILHPFTGSIQCYLEQIADPDRYRPDHCPLCAAKHPLTGHGFYRRTLVDVAFDGIIRVRRYLCRSCKRTVSLLPELALPWLRFSVSVIALFLLARLLTGLMLMAAARMAEQNRHALPAWAVLDSPFSKTGAGFEFGAGAAGGTDSSGGLCLQSPADARIHRMDRRAPLPVFTTTCSPVGLAGGSSSGGAAHHAVYPVRCLLRFPTAHLHAGKSPSRIWFCAGRFPRWMPKPKSSPCSAMD